jgi:hypothetical protein
MNRLSVSAASLAPALFSMPAHAGAISVPIDQAKVITFAAPVSTVYVGNPSMADVTVIDPHRVFVLGKAFGTTNLIALDQAGKLMSNDALKVEGHDTNTVTLNRGSAQFTYACAGARCEAAPVPGDEPKTWYDPVTAANTQRQGMGQKQALASNSTPPE